MKKEKNISPDQKKNKKLTSMHTLVVWVLHEFRLGADMTHAELVNKTGVSVMTQRQFEKGHKNLTVHYMANLCNALCNPRTAPWATLPNLFILVERFSALLVTSGWTVTLNPLQEDNLRGVMKAYYDSHGFARRMHRQELGLETMLLVDENGLLKHEMFNYILDTSFRAKHKELEKVDFGHREHHHEFSEAGEGIAR